MNLEKIQRLIIGYQITLKRNKRLTELKEISNEDGQS